MPNPLYNYGPPVVVTGTGGSAAVTTGEVENGGSNGTPHTPPVNTGSSAGTSGSPSEEMVTLYKPTLTSISPNTAVVGGANLTMTCTGTKFQPSTSPAPSVINFNKGPEATTYVSPTSVTTQVRPSTASGPAVVPVTVKNLGLESESRDFTFTAT